MRKSREIRNRRNIWGMTHRQRSFSFPFPTVHPNDGLKPCFTLAVLFVLIWGQGALPSCHLHSSHTDPGRNGGVLLSIYTLGVNLWHQLKNERRGRRCRKNNLQVFSSLLFHPGKSQPEDLSWSVSRDRNRAGEKSEA